MGHIKIGFTSFDGVLVPVNVPIKNHVHYIIAGGSGSGKTVLTLYLIHQLKQYTTDFYVADFKNTKDYEDITEKYAVGMDCINLFLEFYEKYQAIKDGREHGKIWFLWDEMAGNLIWLEGQDKKLCNDIKGKMSEILMMGREMAGGSAGIISVLQRPDAAHFGNYGGRDNYHVKILMGNSSAEAKKMLGFNSDEVPADFKGGTGKGLLLIDAKPYPIAFTVPKIDKGRLTRLLQKKAEKPQNFVP